MQVLLIGGASTDKDVLHDRMEARTIDSFHTGSYRVSSQSRTLSMTASDAMS